MTDRSGRGPLADGFDRDPFHQFLGLTLGELSPGSATLRLDVRPATPRNADGSLHGGVLATIVDVAALMALAPGAPPGRRTAGTAELNLSYLRPALGPGFTARAETVKFGRSLAVAEVSILDEQGRLCVRGRATYAVRETGDAAQ